MKERFRSNSFKFGAFSLIMSAVVIAIVIGVNLAAKMLPQDVVNFDMTEDKLYSISEKTETVVKGIGSDVTIYLINSGGTIDEGISQTASRYADLSGHIRVETVEPDTDMAFISKYELGDSLSRNGTDVLVAGEKRYKFIPYDDIYEYVYGDYQTAYSMARYYGDSSYLEKQYDAEGEITGAIIYVTTDELPKLYTLEGHKESAIDPAAQTLLDRNNFETAGLNLLTEGKVPEDCDILMIYLPNSDFSQDEVDILEDYVAHGGNIIIVDMTLTNRADMPNFDAFLEYYGVYVTHRQYIFETRANCISYQGQSIRTYLYEDVPGIGLTNGIDGAVFTTNVSAIKTTDSPRKTLTITPILSSSEGSWLRSDLESIIMDEKIDSDEDGPFDFAVLIKDRSNEGEGSIALFAAPDIFEISSIEGVVSGAANRQVFVNAAASIASLTTNVSISAKATGYRMNTSTEQEVKLSVVLFVVVVPVAVLIIGLAIWIVRRRR